MTTTVAVTPGQASLAEELTAEATVTAIDLASPQGQPHRTPKAKRSIWSPGKGGQPPEPQVGTWWPAIPATAGSALLKAHRRGEKAGGGSGRGKGRRRRTAGAGAGMQATIYADVIDVDKAQQTIPGQGVDKTLSIPGGRIRPSSP